MNRPEVLRSWAELPDGRRFSYWGSAAFINGAWEIVDLEIDAPSGLNSTMLRLIDLPGLLRQANRLPPPRHAIAPTPVVPPASPRPRRGAPPLTESFLRSVAVKYLDASRDDARGAIRRLADETGAARQTVELWVRRAAQAGFLTNARIGRAGRGPGPALAYATAAR